MDNILSCHIINDLVEMKDLSRDFCFEGNIALCVKEFNLLLTSQIKLRNYLMKNERVEKHDKRQASS